MRNLDPARASFHYSFDQRVIVAFHENVSIALNLTTEVFAKFIVLLIYFLPLVN